jgi:DNA-binding HxlR family transcriptional regulator
MAKRSYRQNCALAQASDVIGERWSLLLVRDLLVGPRRFNELSRSLKGIGSNLLAARLKELEAAGIIERQTSDAGAHLYALTEVGQALEPALLALVRWGLSYGPGNQEGFHHQDDWDLLALKALFQPDRVGDLSVSVQFKTEEFTAWMAIDDQQVTMGPGEAPEPDITVNGTIKDLFTGPGSPDELCVSDSHEKLGQFMSAFALPA